MRTIDAETVNTLLAPPSLVTALHGAFRDSVETPVRHHHTAPMGTREADDAAIVRARIFVDTRAGAMSEAGDIVQPLEARLLAPEDILAELAELCRDEHPSRTDPNEISLFKSVETALEDLAAAELLIDRLEP